MSMRRLFIIRKDLHLTAGKLSAMVGHCCEAYWTNWIKKHVIRKCYNLYPCESSDPLKVRDGLEERQMQLYKHGDLCQLSEKAFKEGKAYFLACTNEEGRIVEDTELKYDYEFAPNTIIEREIFEDYINASFVKTICEAKNLNHLLKVVDKAKELGLKEESDFGLINDICRTELEPENEDGTCTVGIWFKPLKDEIAHELSKKYQLYKG